MPKSSVAEALDLWKAGDCSFLHSGCEIPGAHDSGWGAVIKPEHFPLPDASRRAIKQAMDAMQRPRGRDPYVTLELLGYELRRNGECATGPWEDAVGLRYGQYGLEIHAVGGEPPDWITNYYKGAWPWNGVWP